jgi:hypothetical protein
VGTSVSHANIITSLLPTHLHIYIPLTRRTNSKDLGTFQKQGCLGNRGALDRKVVSFRVIFKGLMTTGKKEYVVSNHDEWKDKRKS